MNTFGNTKNKVKLFGSLKKSSKTKTENNFDILRKELENFQMKKSKDEKINEEEEKKQTEEDILIHNDDIIKNNENEKIKKLSTNNSNYENRNIEDLSCMDNQDIKKNINLSIEDNDKIKKCSTTNQTNTNNNPMINSCCNKNDIIIVNPLFKVDTNLKDNLNNSLLKTNINNTKQNEIEGKNENESKVENNEGIK